MTRLVLDTNVVLKWFGSRPEPGRDEALALRAAVRSRTVEALVPSLVELEVLNVAGRRWSWPADDLAELADALRNLPWTVAAPPLPTVAKWVARGLTAYDAAYVAVAVAEAWSCRVVTADERMIEIASDLTIPLVSA